MRIPKRYGQSKELSCPFCVRVATQKNAQGIDVCFQHTKEVLQEIKCTCGSWLEQRSGKFGPYFNCLNCGNINFKRGMEMKALQKGKETTIPKAISAPEKKEVHSPRETTISTDDVEYFD
ncbi:MAG TPA: hypothetical protein VJI32_07010 [Candidatus Nanoarchaeia archaeon]|nr:hypothetical protein [Candidatus Woesearchaeota archaeon]HIG93074.1 hypothetical protein [Candidatus Woesearchaeota archaeon]HIH13364.1 hypothetical protein [Candidatus Woesearchaeota archaeon]HLC71733.1 hypothetical protein [Candidatus Nanoarchaeia archaeon]